MSHPSLQAFPRSEPVFPPTEPTGAHSIRSIGGSQHSVPPRAFPPSSCGSAAAAAFPSYSNIAASHLPIPSRNPSVPADPFLEQGSSQHFGSQRAASAQATSGVAADAEFNQLSMEDLREVLTQRDDMVAELRREIADLEREPAEFQRRLVELEKVFQNVTSSDVIKLRSPVLRNISQAIRADHTASHDEAKPDDATTAALKPSAEHFALGRGCLHIDRVQMAMEEEVKREGDPRVGEQVWKRYSPPDDLMKYAGHLGHPHGSAGAVLVGPAGVAIGRRPLAHPTGGEFWLKASGFVADEEGGVREVAAAVDVPGMAKLRRAAALEAVYGAGAANTMQAHHGPP